MNPIRALIDRYLRGDATLEDTIAGLGAREMDTPSLAIGFGALRPDQRARADLLVQRLMQNRKKEAERVLAEARRLGKTIAEAHLVDESQSKDKPKRKHR